MKNCIPSFLCCLLLCSHNCHAQSATLLWQKTFGSSGNEVIHDVYPTADGNHIVLGIADSSNSDVSCDLKGRHDAWVFKMDASGAILWQQCFGGSKEEANPYAKIIQTSDGGYLFITESWSDDFDVIGHHGQSDVLTVKLDASGNKVWSHSFGGNKFDVPRNILELPDQKYLIISRSTSSNGDVPPDDYPHGFDAWVYIINNTGNIISNKKYGGSGDDDLYSALISPDGNLLFFGHTSSTDGDLAGLDTDSLDGWVLKTDLSGNVLSSKVYGQENAEEFFDGSNTPDGGYMAFGQSEDPEMPVDKGMYHGSSDLWAVKLDQSGNIEWQGMYGGSLAESFSRAEVSSNNSGYYLTGGSASSDGDIVSDSVPGLDLWVLQIGLDGTLFWNLKAGGSKGDFANSLTQSGIAAGASTSLNGDVTGLEGTEDGWVVKFLSVIISPVGPLTLCKGVPLTLVASGTNINSYQWYKNGVPVPGETSSTYTTKFGNDYHVVVYGDSGSTALSNIVYVERTDIPVATITPSGTIEACKNEEVTLTASAGDGYSYKWFNDGQIINGETDSSFSSAVLDGSVTVVITAFTCSDTSEATIIERLSSPKAKIIPLGILDICLTGMVTLKANTGIGYSYQWLLDQVEIAGATNQLYLAETAGNYKVEVTNAENCTKQSKKVTVFSSCKLTLSQKIDSIDIFPNPTDGNFRIRFSEDEKFPEVKIEMYDFTGRKILEQLSNPESGLATIQPDLSLPDGLYWVKLSGKDFSIQKPVVLIR